MSLNKLADTFKKRLAANSSLGIIESATQRKRPNENVNERPRSKKPRSDPNRESHRSVGGGSNANFLLLSKIVKHMKMRHQERETQPLKLDEILEEMKQTDLEARTKAWLQSFALKSNLKIECVKDDRYIYKPEYNIRGRKSLEGLLDEHRRFGLGGICVDDVEESLAHYEKILELLKDKMTRIQGADKKDIIFPKLVGLGYPIRENLQQIWRSTPVDGLDENRIRDYLHKKNLSSVKNNKPVVVQQQKKKSSRKIKARSDNLHLNGVLDNYD